jgi:hypothetical protein
MSLWGNLDNATGNDKPLYANTSLTTSQSTINGTAANTVKYYGVVAGVSVTEEERSNTTPQHPTHAGWVSLKIGTGPITSITATGGTGINAAGFLIVTDTSDYGRGANVNIAFTTANSQNTLQVSSPNSAWNTIGTLTIVDGGDGFSSVDDITVDLDGDYTDAPTFTITLGGRAGRIATETLVAMGSISGDDPADNVWYTGV